MTGSRVRDGAPRAHAVAALLPQHGRTAIVTGANSGIGFHTARSLAEAGARVVLACRSTERATSARDEIVRQLPGAEIDVLRLDLADLAQVADAAREAIDRFGSIHVCVNNAGLIVRSRSTTVEGFETTFGVNHLGHFAWTGHLLPALLVAPDSRIVNVSSMAHLKATMDWGGLMGEATFSPVRAYRRSKVANLLHIVELDRRLSVSDRSGASDTTAVAAHPGISSSSFWENGAGPRLRWVAKAAEGVIRMAFSTAAQGAAPVTHAAAGPGVLAAACYGPRVAQRWGRPGVVRVSEQARDPEAARRLWALSEELTGVEVL